MSKRIEWIDQVIGLGIFLVVYGHNFPIFEKYIYSFHMPLFFMIAGLFHARVQNLLSIKKRARSVLVPYFLWSLMLFLFWWEIGRFYGESVKSNLSVLNNFIGVFYAQGGQDYMDWGIPMWFIPCIFLSFLFFYVIRLIKAIKLQIFTLLTFIFLGFLLPRIFHINFIWSLDVALVSLVFYGFGFYLKKTIIKISKIKTVYLLFFVLAIHISLFGFNDKVDMYRSTYGNEILFILNGISGALTFICLFKLIPIAFLISKYFPILNGGYKKI